jgi:hypothetical protein
MSIELYGMVRDLERRVIQLENRILELQRHTLQLHTMAPVQGYAAPNPPLGQDCSPGCESVSPTLTLKRGPGRPRKEQAA